MTPTMGRTMKRKRQCQPSKKSRREDAGDGPAIDGSNFNMVMEAEQERRTAKRSAKFGRI
jgi:hypothetical protein